jgi:hypothetical protein
MSKRVVVRTCILMLLAASCSAWGLSLGTVQVELSGETPIWPETTERYTATVTDQHELDDKAEEEVQNGGTIVTEYEWQYTPAQCKAGGGSHDSYVDVEYSAEDAGQDYTIRVTYTVKLMWEGEVAAQTSDSDEMTVHVYENPSAEVLAVTYDSDHGVLRDNNTDWSNAGNLYPEPEWDNNTNAPISHTMGEPLTMTVTVDVEPADLDLDLHVPYPDAPYHSGTASFTSTGEPQNVTITMSTSLPNSVGVLNAPPIDWYVCGLGPEYADVPAGQSGGTTIYLTLGTPGGSVVTEKRLAYVCGVCGGQSTLRGVADAIYADLCSREQPTLNPGAPLTQPSWLLLGETPMGAPCIGLAMLMRDAVNMVGGQASVGYIYARPTQAQLPVFASVQELYSTRGCAADYAPRPGVPPPPDGWPDEHDSYGDEQLRVKHGRIQKWEGVCVAAGKYYGVKLTAAEGPLVFLHQWLNMQDVYQAWVIFTSGLEGWRNIVDLCQIPGPLPQSPPPLP